jgi:malonyl CoA-acyl carrier protein transacylase
MGRELYEGERVFREAVERVAAAVAGELEHGLVEVLYGGRGAALEETAYTQVGLFAVEWALAEQWRAWGVEPAVVVGHSVGEFAAACVAGVLEVEAAARLVAARGRLMGALPRGGAMVAVHADEATVQGVVGAVGGAVGIAAVNGPESVVVSGAAAAVGAVVEGLTAAGVRSQGLRVSHAFHSALMEPMLGAFGTVAGTVEHGVPRGRWVSTVTGREVEAGEVTGAYWGRQIRQPVRFADALTTARGLGATVFLEAGPHPVLTGVGREWLSDVGWIPSLRRAHADRSQMLEGLAELYIRGAAVGWAAVHGLPARGRVSLPTYPWQRGEHWLHAAPTHRREADADGRWAAIVTAGRAQAGQVPLDLDLASYAGKWRALDELTRASILRTLQGLGLFAAAGEGWTVDEFIRARGIVPGYRPLLTRWLRRLAGEGLLLEVAPDSFVAPAALPDAREEAALETARLALHDVPQIFDYVARSGARLVEFLTGTASPLETLFPGGALDTATALYQDWAVSRYVSAIAGAALSAAVDAAAGRPVRVLEVGAGTGGTAAVLIPRLAPDRGAYWFTDVSAAFLAAAQGRFGAYPFVRYAALDVEREPADQGFVLAGFDVVVATNVVHATRDVEATLRRLRALLAPGGLLILGEATTHLSWFDVTTGLIEGWQRFEDAPRADSPLLEPEVWERLLAAVGFDAVASVPEASSPATVLGQHVVIARAPATDPRDPASTAAHHDVAPADLRPPAATAPVGDVARRLVTAREADRHGLALEYVAEQVAAVLRVKGAEALDPGQRLMDLGLDSLMALELRGRLAVGLGRRGGVPATLVFEHPTIDAVARYVVREAMGVEASNPVVRPAPEDPAAKEAGARIAHLSEDEVTALLMKKLASL